MRSRGSWRDARCSGALLAAASRNKKIYFRKHPHHQKFGGVSRPVCKTVENTPFRIEYRNFECEKLDEALIFPEELQNGSTIEANINQHFARLHGVLQNMEKRMIDKLYEQQNHMKDSLNDMKQRLDIQQEQVQLGLLMATAMKEMTDKLCLKDGILKLERLADVPCHLVRDSILENEKITFSPDLSIFEILENHCTVEVPKVAGFTLLSEDTLPEEYEIEPLDEEDVSAGVRTEKSVMDRSITSPVSYQTLSARRLMNKGLIKAGKNQVYMCYVENPSNFYVRLSTDQQQANELQEQLNYYVGKSKEPEIVQKNDIYAVQLSNKKWYRGRVNGINTKSDSPDTYEVFTVDFGKIVNVTKSHLRTIPPQIAKVPATIINCCLYEIVPKDGEWRSKSRQAMLDIIKPERNRAVTMFIVSTTENMYMVDICAPPPDNGVGFSISVRDTLLHSGYGQFVTSKVLRHSSPQSVRTFLREHLTIDAYHNVYVSHVVSPDCIYVQKTGDHLIYLANLTTTMSNLYLEISKLKDMIIYVPELGTMCAIEKNNGVWCRGIVTGIPEPQTVQVFLVDFGPTITTNCNKIRKLNEKFTHSAVQAIKVSLADIKSCEGDQWTVDAVEFTKKWLDEKFGRVVAFKKLETGYSVALYIQDDVNVGAMLVTENFAVSTGPRSFGMVPLPTVQTVPKKTNPTLRNSRTKVGKKKSKRNNAKSLLNQQNKNQYNEKIVETTESSDPYRLPIKIIRLESPETIYVATLGQEKFYEKMSLEMQKFYNTYSGGVSKDHDWIVDSPCAVYSEREKLFCRGRIVSIDANDVARVFLYDLGFDTIVPIGELQALKKKFWFNDAYVFKVKLGGISPCGGSSDWLASSCEKLRDIVNDGSNKQFYISKVNNPGEKDLHVELWVDRTVIDGPLSPSVIKTDCVNQMLVKSGFAVPMKSYENSKVLALDLKRQISYRSKQQRNENFKFIENQITRGETEDESNSSTFESRTTTPDTVNQSLISNDETIDSWLPAEPIVEDEFVAVATNVDNDCFVYLYPIDRNDTLTLIEHTLTSEYSKSKTKPKDFQWEKGDLCISRYHGNDKWCRGQVREVLENMIKVEFVDYGSVEDCDIGTLRKRLRFTEIPRQCTKCAIMGLHPNTPNGKWVTNDLDVIHFTLVDHSFKVVVQKRMDDHLVVSIDLLNPDQSELTSYLIDKLKLSVCYDHSDEDDDNPDESSSESSNPDVIVEGYINTNRTIVDKNSNPNDEDVNEESNVCNVNDNKNFEDESNVCNNDEDVKDESKILVNDEDVKDESKIFVNDKDVKDESKIFVNDKDVKDESTIFVNDKDVKDESKILVNDKNVKDDSKIFVSDKNVKDESTIFVNDKDVKDESKILVNDKNVKDESTIFVNDKDVKDESKIFVNDKKVTDESKIFVNDKKVTDESKTFVNDKDVKDESKIFINDKDVKDESKTFVNDKNVKDETIIRTNFKDESKVSVNDKIIRTTVKDKSKVSVDDKIIRKNDDDTDDLTIEEEKSKEEDSRLKNIRQNKENIDEDDTDDVKEAASSDEYEKNESEFTDEFQTVIFREDEKKKEEQFDVASENNEDFPVLSEDPVLAGTLKISSTKVSSDFDDRKSSMDHEIMSMTGSNNEFVTSTPHEESLDFEIDDPPDGIVIFDNVKIVKAQIAVMFPNECWLHLLDNKNSDIVTRACELYDQMKNTIFQAVDQPVMEHLEKGSICCARYNDGMWYRCQVIDCQSSIYDTNENVSVRFIDWGNCADVRRDELRDMKEEWMKPPRMGLHCRLSGIEVSPTVDDEFAIKLRDTFCTIENVYAEIKDYESGTYDVHLYKDENCTQLVYESLIEEGLYLTKDTTKID